MEFIRIGYSIEKVQEVLIEWNLTKVVPRLADEDIINLVDWVSNINRELGCNGKLKELGFCKKEYWGSCPYLDLYHRINQEKVEYEDSQYDSLGWPEFLIRRYRNGYEADRVYRELRIVRKEYGILQNSIIYVGALKLATRIRKKERDFKPDAMRILSAVHTLVKSGLVIIAEKGKKGKKNGKANGYQIVYPIPHPP